MVTALRSRNRVVRENEGTSKPEGDYQTANHGYRSDINLEGQEESGSSHKKRALTTRQSSVKRIVTELKSED
jgi:hypothetical protein